MFTVNLHNDIKVEYGIVHTKYDFVFPPDCQLGV